ncbi:hypothetical protein [Paraburkholderia unamae]|uniref:Uncharacterized protein n=1 Tax=Paraburkholderia unamae TaxID=219649 RepID=A0ACC6RIY3_9BURK
MKWIEAAPGEQMYVLRRSEEQAEEDLATVWGVCSGSKWIWHAFVNKPMPFAGAPRGRLVRAPATIALGIFDSCDAAMEACVVEIVSTRMED